MRVLIAGATGVIGSRVTERLLAGGHEVVGLSRSEAGAARLRSMGAEGIVADMLDGAALSRALDGVTADAVIHEGTALTKPPMRHRDLYPTDRLRTRGTANLLEVARQVGARRFLTQSFIYVYGFRDHGELRLTEDTPLAPPGPAKFAVHAAAMRANEQNVLGATDLDGIALRYGFFYGPEVGTFRLMDMAARRRLPVPVRGSWMSAIHVDDAAAATVAALERGRAGEAYNVADDVPLTWTEYFDALAETVGAPKPLRVPNAVLAAMPYLGHLVTRASIRLDNRKAKSELGWSPRYPSIHDGLPSAIDGWRRRL